jgi:putative phosphoesterase
LGDPASSPVLASHILKDETVTFVSTLPSTLQLEWGERRVLLAHGTPWSFDDYLFSYSGQDVFERVARYAAATAKADVVVLGHTHEPMAAQVKDLWIVNPGSVCGLYGSGSRTCAVLSLPACNLTVYDIGSATRLSIPYVEY